MVGPCYVCGDRSVTDVKNFDLCEDCYGKYLTLQKNVHWKADAKRLVEDMRRRRDQEAAP